MISRQHYKEFIQEQGNIESGTAEDYGYKITSGQYVPKQKRLSHNLKVSKIDPIRHIVQIPPSKALLKVEEDLLMMQNQKRLNQMTEKAKASLQRVTQDVDIESAAVKMMNHCFQEYNFLLEHRHIIEKNSQRARKLLGIKKTKQELIVEEIAILKNKIPRSTFSEVIQINKKIAQLYRDYEKNINLQKSPTQVTQITRSIKTPYRSKTQISGSSNISYFNSSKFSPGKITQKRSSSNQSQQAKSGQRKQKMVEVKDIIIMQEMKQSQSGDGESFALKRSIDMRDIECPSLKVMHAQQPQSLFLGRKFLKMQKKNTDHERRKRLYTVNEKIQRKSEVKQPRMKMSETLTQNFISKEWMDKGSALDRDVQYIEDVLEVWRHRVDSNKQKNLSNLGKFMTPNKKKSRKNTIKQTQNASQQEAKNTQRLEKAKKIREFQMQAVKDDMAEKQKVLSIMIKKRQSRFIKIPGTQILKVNDPCQTAKLYLGTSDQRRSEVRDAIHNSQNKVETDPRYFITDIPEWMNIQKESEDLYWSMLRNQKINLLLKNSEKR